MSQDYYQTLGVSPDADAKTLKSAYRKLAMQYHPDRNPGDAEAEKQFKQVSEAYDVLKDEQKRAAYDRYGHDAFTQGMAGGGSGRGPGGPEFDMGGFSDIFEQFFGDMGGARGQDPRRGGGRRGADLRYDLEITLEEAFQGLQQEITIPTTVECDTCSGTGAEPGTKPEVCGTCSGRGKVRSQQGFFVVERTCPTCRGVGTIIANPCKACSGSGRLEKRKKLNVTIPRGVENGNRIRLSGEGEAGMRGGGVGDLYIFVTIAPHQIFKRDGATLYCLIPVPMTTAILGGEIEVPTIAGTRAKVKVPEGTQSGRQFRLRSKGMPQLNSGITGDMIIEVQIETPVNLNKRQRELMEEFAEESGDNSSPRSKSFFDKVKDIWEDLTD